jgi:cytoplasmic iron level regulating protein YaaA (DUF328/UPF0246 family)|tara:strand:- start:50 stop:814 length:765 start_codon:yes stop_codon:yes gene_type:complete
MLAIVSPAKKLQFSEDLPHGQISQPLFTAEIKSLVATMQGKSAADLMQLMHISEKLATLNYKRYQGFADQFDVDTARQAAFLFQGDTYVGLQAESFSDDDLQYAQEHFAILSGLYGILRPLDLMQPYRLEMGTKIANDHGENLYDFWGDKITQYIQGAIKDHKAPYVVNLASNEYIKAVKAKAFGAYFITCHFKENRDGKLKTIGLMAKRARGMMARYMVQRRIDAPEGLKKFTDGGYAFDASLSDAQNLYFTR